MTMQEAVKDLNRMFKEENEQEETKKLKEKIDTLEKVIINLATRLDYLESRCQ